MPLLESLRRLTAGIPHPGVLLEKKPVLADMADGASWQRCENHACTGLKCTLGTEGRRFEGRWVCSEGCWSAMLLRHIEREIGTADPEGVIFHRHRLPLGLLLLSLGWITADQLQKALESQRAAKQGRIGDWLRKQTHLTEREITRALAMQWSCPVFDLEAYRPHAAEIPREIVEEHRMLPMPARHRGVVYLAFDKGIDAVASYAVRHMTGSRVEAGLAAESVFASQWPRVLSLQKPAAAIVPVETAAEVHDAAISMLGGRPIIDARVTRLRQYLWLRVFDTTLPTLRLRKSENGGQPPANSSSLHATDYLYRLPASLGHPQ